MVVACGVCERGERKEVYVYVCDREGGRRRVHPSPRYEHIKPTDQKAVTDLGVEGGRVGLGGEVQRLERRRDRLCVHTYRQAGMCMHEGTDVCVKVGAGVCCV